MELPDVWNGDYRVIYKELGIYNEEVGFVLNKMLERGVES